VTPLVKGRVAQAAQATDSARGESQAAADLTIEQLAATVGMTVRNIRNHRSRGLLPAPEVRGRVGYYGAEHVARLRLIRDLQADGFNLAAIKRLLDASTGSAGRVLGLRDAMMAPYETEVPDVINAEEVAARYPELDHNDLELLIKLGLLVPLGDGSFERSSPALVGAYDQLTAKGIPPGATLALVERLSRECDTIARRFVQLYMDELWQPFAEAGQPAERWDEVIATIGVLRATASEALLAMFKLRMTAAVQTASDRLLAEQAKAAPDAPASPGSAASPAV
jgi:DNA-binding transcriptional MerR regulator